MNSTFEGRTCIVTGAASGIGLALSELLLMQGALVHLADFDEPGLSAAVGRLSGHGERVHSSVVDVTSEAQVRRLIEGTAADLGSLDYLFNNAGVGATFPIENATLEHWTRIVDLNLWGVIYGVHAALPIMRRQRRGHIVNTASIAGLIPLPFQVLYCTTKFAVVGLSESLRLEVADDGIAVSVVCPGNVVSRIWGTPIIGARSGARPPPDSIPAEAAAQMILEGVASKEGIIPLPESTRAHWNRYRTSPEESDRLLLDLARQRRKAADSGHDLSTAAQP